MRRWLGWIGIGWLLAVCALALLAYGNPSAQPSLDVRARSLAGQMRCLVCAGESVADSQSGFAQGVRDSIRRQLDAGRSDQQVKSFFIEKYGQQILLAPPSSGLGSVAWLAPPLLLLGGLGLLITLVLDWRSRGRRPAGVKETYLERVRVELAADSAGE